jgi:hypothetical protein
MRSDVAHLEEQLLVRWSHETLVAYGEALRDAGDPRGELIAIDLGTGDPDAKPELEAAWLGEEAADAVTTQFGFVVDCLDLEAALPALDRIVPYARAFDLHGEPSEVLEALAILARAPRPWLGTLQLRQLDARVLPLVDDALARRLIDATPHLRKLVVHGHRVLSQFPHPALERLVADGHDAIATLLGHGVLPRVDTLDLALHPDTDIEREPPPDELRALLPASALPQLRTLDLSRNEPRELPLAPNSLGGKTPIYDVLGRLGVLPQLAQLRVPSIRTHDQREHLQAALDRMPNLRMLEIARMYVKARVALRHRTARITVPPPCPWPAADGVGDHDALLFELDGEQFRCELDRAHEVVEAATLDAGQRAAWATLWSIAEDLTTRDEDKPDKLATSLLATVLDTFPTTSTPRGTIYASGSTRRARARSPCGASPDGRPQLLRTTTRTTRTTRSCRRRRACTRPHRGSPSSSSRYRRRGIAIASRSMPTSSSSSAIRAAS